MRGAYRDSQGLHATANLMEIHFEDDYRYPMHGWIITSIDVRPDHRGQGAGSRLLRDIIADADREGVNLYLSVDADSSGGLSNQQLRDWYMRHGFKPLNLKSEFESSWTLERVIAKNQVRQEKVSGNTN